MNINNAFDTDLMVLALGFSLQAVGVKAKPQVVSEGGMCLFVTGSRDQIRYSLITLLIGRWR